MKIAWSPTAFSVLFCLSYLVVFGLELPLFLYYPVNGDWVWGAEPDPGKVGPAMAWYGLMATSALVAAFGAFCIREAWLVARLRRVLWVSPYAAVVGCVYYLRPYFI